MKPNEHPLNEEEKLDLILGLIHSKYHMDAGSDDMNEREMAKTILKVCRLPEEDYGKCTPE